MPREQMQRIAGNLELMGQVMTVAGFLGAVALVLLTLEDVTFAVVLGILGAGLTFGMPILVASNLQANASTPASAINTWSGNAGMGMLFVVGVRILWEIISQIRNAGSRGLTAEEKAAAAAVVDKKKKWKKPGLWDHCWDMPYCHEAVRDICPAYKARKSCWRFGYGCNCDPSLIETLIRTGGSSLGKGVSKETAAQRVRDAYVRSDLAADAVVGTGQRTIPCSKCSIFVEHQRQKFRVLNPVAVVGTIVGLAFLYKPLLAVYTQVINFMAALAARLTYGDRIDPGEWIQYLNTPTVQIFFFVFVGLIALAYVLKAVEWAILKRMIL